MQNVDRTTLANAQAASFDIKGVTETLNIIADKRDELRGRIRYAQLCFELNDAEIDTGQLAADVAEFKRLCACLSWGPQ